MCGFLGCIMANVLIGNRILQAVTPQLPRQQFFAEEGSMPLWRVYLRLGLPPRLVVWHAVARLGAVVCFCLMIWIMASMVGHPLF